MKRIVASLIVAAAAVNGQTGAVIRQGVSPAGVVDFSTASSTKPYRVGAAVPATCVSGEIFFKLNAGLYECLNGGYVPVGSGGAAWGTIQGVISAQSDLWSLLTISGDVQRAASTSAATVTGINGATVPASAVLKSNASAQLVAAAAGADYQAPVTGDVTSTTGGAVTVTKLNGVSLAGLSSGLLTNTTGTGVPTITALPLSPTKGGVGTMTGAPMWLRYFGDGSEGAVSCTSSYAAGEHWVSSFTVPNGSTCNTTAWGAVSTLIIRSTGACTIAGTLTASALTTAASGTASFGGSGGGGGGGTAAGASGSASGKLAWNSATALSGGSAGAASGGVGGNGAALASLSAAQQQMALGQISAMPVNGGAAGGQGGSTGGAGGLGGGLIVLNCASINFTGAITANGGAGTNAAANNTGAGGGGGGGYVVMATPTWTAATGTITTTGGSGGSCGAYTGCGAGGAGGAGGSKTFTIQ